jgi:hypothetical protein
MLFMAFLVFADEEVKELTSNAYQEREGSGADDRCLEPLDYN